MKTALIGLGMVSGTFADAIQNSADVTLKSIYARNPDRRTAFLAKHPKTTRCLYNLSLG